MRIATRMAIMPITTRSSTRVKPRRIRCIDLLQQILPDSDAGIVAQNRSRLNVIRLFLLGGRVSEARPSQTASAKADPTKCLAKPSAPAALLHRASFIRLSTASGTHPEYQ